jgi:hypothetical protein
MSPNSGVNQESPREHCAAALENKTMVVRITQTENEKHTKLTASGNMIFIQFNTVVTSVQANGCVSMHVELGSKRQG